ncbi:MAG: ABC transporter ATP-binding protein [Planctomycetota bacterium]
MSEPILEVEDLCVTFHTDHGAVRAVDGVSFTLAAGETLGLVGESGSGKSVTNLALMGLVPTPPGTVSARRLAVGGRDLAALSPKALRKVRGNEVAMIFQDPMTSLNPLLTIGRQLTEVLEVHERARGREATRRAAAGLADVGIPEPERRLKQYPHELSGGMRQRVMIAMALLCEPKVLLADEPTTALDVTIQAQILELMKALQEKHGTAIVLVTHDLGVVAGMADRVNVMYAGRLVETAPTGPLFQAPRHPYTLGLLGSVPRLAGDPHARLLSIPGQPPDLAALPAGCAFMPRCGFASERCRAQAPLRESVALDRTAACFEIGRVEAARAAGSLGASFNTQGEAR